MSEPLSAVEIEDVLSSIRRLVSEDLRPAARAAAVPKPALILTPALRVVAEGAASQDPPPVAMPIEQVVAHVAAAVPPQDWEPEAGDAMEKAPPSWADLAWDAPSTAAQPAPATEDAPADATDDAVAADAPGWAQAGVDGEEVLDATLSEERASVDDAQPADADWVTQAEAEVIAGLESRDERPAFDAFAAEPEISFDEEVLRDLVRDLIREELQGHLGERITRNIRKLVRAEIARALAAAELG